MSDDIIARIVDDFTAGSLDTRPWIKGQVPALRRELTATLEQHLGEPVPDAEPVVESRPAIEMSVRDGIQHWGDVALDQEMYTIEGRCTEVRSSSKTGQLVAFFLEHQGSRYTHSELQEQLDTRITSEIYAALRFLEQSTLFERMESGRAPARYGIQARLTPGERPTPQQSLGDPKEWEGSFGEWRFSGGKMRFNANITGAGSKEGRASWYLLNRIGESYTLAEISDATGTSITPSTIHLLRRKAKVSRSLRLICKPGTGTYGFHPVQPETIRYV